VSGPALCRASPGLTFARSLPSDRGKTCSDVGLAQEVIGERGRGLVGSVDACFGQRGQGDLADPGLGAGIVRLVIIKAGLAGERYVAGSDCFIFTEPGARRDKIEHLYDLGVEAASESGFAAESIAPATRPCLWAVVPAEGR
jgi:hypothetical protein